MSKSSNFSIEKIMKEDSIKLFTKVLLVVMLLCFIFVIVSISSSTSTKCDGGSGCTCNKTLVENYASVENIPNEQGKFVLDYNTAYNSYQRLELTAPVSEETGAPKNLLFGQAERYILQDGTINLNISGDLYILGGDTYDSGVAPVLGKNDLDTDSTFASFTSTKTTDFYSVYTSTDQTSEQKLIGNLQKDGDGLYRLKTSLKVSPESINTIWVYYENGKDKVLVIVGQFN
jgi:hypothetical protein